MLVEHPVALARADKNLKKDILWISVSAVGMFLGSPSDIQRIGPMSEIDIFWTSTGLTCVMWEAAVGSAEPQSSLLLLNPYKKSLVFYSSY
jgi:hypothetical protein